MAYTGTLLLCFPPVVYQSQWIPTRHSYHATFNIKVRLTF